VCLAIALPLGEQDLKRDVLRKIEAALGRVRTQDKFAPREIDIDILMADGRPLNLSRWNDAFVIMPMSELLPQFEHPRLRRPLEHVARGVQEKTWIVRRPDALDTISQKL
jgi:7,8-dihydro-6-hydroxymethylpterin-pyrophosphokinase